MHINGMGELSVTIYSAYFHKNGFFIHTDEQEDFWVLLSKEIGYGRFTKLRDDDEFSKTGALMKLVEMRQDLEPGQGRLALSSNVLFRLREGFEVASKRILYPVFGEQTTL